MESGDFDAAFAAYGEFFRLAGYDVVTFEYCIGAAMPPGGALRGGMGPIQSRADLEAFPWEQIPDRYWDLAAPMLMPSATGESET